MRKRFGTCERLRRRELKERDPGPDFAAGCWAPGRAMGHKVSASSIPKLLGQLGYRRHVNRKTKDGSNHPDRDAQFEYINAKAREFQAADQPVISVDTKKKGKRFSARTALTR